MFLYIWCKTKGTAQAGLPVKETGKTCKQGKTVHTGQVDHTLCEDRHVVDGNRLLSELVSLHCDAVMRDILSV